MPYTLRRRVTGALQARLPCCGSVVGPFRYRCTAAYAWNHVGDCESVRR